MRLFAWICMFLAVLVMIVEGKPTQTANKVSASTANMKQVKASVPKKVTKRRDPNADLLYLDQLLL